MSKIDSSLPAMVDDDNTGRTGTREDVAFFQMWRDAINLQVASNINPTVMPADTIDEVITARGSKSSLDDRLDVSLNEDGTLKDTATSTLITVTEFMGGLGGVNLVTNDDYLLWADGDASAPDGYTLSGGSVTRCGTGLGDTTRKIGDFCAKMTRSGTDITLKKSLLSGAAFTRADFVKSLYACAGAWVKCSTPNVARIALYDGAGYTYSSYHTGDGTWEFLPVTRQINVAATELSILDCVSNSDASAHFSGWSLLLLDSNQTLSGYVPSPCLYGSMHFSISGNLSVLSNVGRMMPARSGIVKDVQCHLKTAPLVTAAIFDVNTWDGASLTSMFSTRPQVAAGANYGGAQPDTTYARRCLKAMSGASIVAGGILTLDVDQIGTGTVGADASVEVRVLQYASPLERFQTY